MKQKKPEASQPSSGGGGTVQLGPGGATQSGSSGTSGISQSPDEQQEYSQRFKSDTVKMYYIYKNDKNKLVRESFGTVSSAKKHKIKADEPIQYGGKTYYRIIDSISGNIGYAEAKDIAFKQGGLVDFTGFGWLDGTKSKPEAVLTNEQFRALKELAENFEKVRQNYNQNSAKNITLPNLPMTSNSNVTNNADGSINIENIELKMFVSQIANNQNINKVSENILNKIVDVARKSGNQGLSRR